jgi:peptide/nickel transport system permease protein
MMPLITTWAALLPSFISGSIVVEYAFGIPGMGRLSVESVFEKDPELVLSTTLVAGLLGLVSFLLADIAYAIADPRVSYEAEAT